MASGREDWEERTTGRERERERERERGGIRRRTPVPEFPSVPLARNAFSFRRFASGSGRIRQDQDSSYSSGFPAISWISSSAVTRLGLRA